MLTRHDRTPTFLMADREPAAVVGCGFLDAANGTTDTTARHRDDNASFRCPRTYEHRCTTIDGGTRYCEISRVAEAPVT
jgi:hypothetical protein